MKKVFLAAFLPAILSLSVQSHAWSGNFNFTSNRGDSKFATRLKSGALAHVEMHGLIVNVSFTMNTGEVENYVARAKVDSIDCKNGASFQAVSEDRHEVLMFMLSLEDSEDQKCEMFPPSEQLVLSVSSFDLIKTNPSEIRTGLAVFEVHRRAINWSPF